MKKKYDNRMKAKLILQFYKQKIKSKTGILLKKILWHQFPEDCIIHWPEKTKNVFHLPLDQLNEVLERLDQLYLSQDFLASINQPQKCESFESKITGYFRDLFKYDAINWKKPVPWNKLTSADFQNWPQDVPVKRSKSLTRLQRKELYDVLRRVKLSEHFKNTYKVRMGYSKREKVAFISRHLLNLIRKHVGTTYFCLPKIYPNEILQWPSINSFNPEKLSASDLDYVFLNLNAIDLSETFINRLKALLKSKSKLEALRNELRQQIRDMLNEISNKRKNINIPWSKIKSDSFKWLPAGIQVIDPEKLSSDDLRKILENKDQIRFTDKFKGEYLKYLDQL